MHPALVLIPIVAATAGPRLWAGYLLRRNDRRDAGLPAADDLARELLDQHGLELVCVEATDTADHYDPIAKAVRLHRDRFARRSLTAATTAAHEVGHALQDASGFWPFRLHLALARVSRVTSGIGTLLVIAVPAASMIARRPVSLLVVGAVAAGVLATALAAQVAALPSELNASYRRALPMLRGRLSEEQSHDARRILFACSLTYAAASINPLIVLLPWLGGPWRFPLPALHGGDCIEAVGLFQSIQRRRDSQVLPEPVQNDDQSASKSRRCSGWFAAPRRSIRKPLQPLDHGSGLIKAFARPWIRTWLRLTGDY